MDELNKPYNPKDHEDKLYKEWEEAGYFNPDNFPVSQDTGSKIQVPRFCMVIPPQTLPALCIWATP